MIHFFPHSFICRTSLLLAEQERKGGMAQHLSPYAGVADVGALLTTCKFALPTGMCHPVDNFIRFDFF